MRSLMKELCRKDSLFALLQGTSQREPQFCANEGECQLFTSERAWRRASQWIMVANCRRRCSKSSCPELLSILYIRAIQMVKHELRTKEHREPICDLYSYSKAKKVVLSLSILLIWSESLVLFSLSSPCKICLPWRRRCSKCPVPNFCQYCTQGS